MYCRMFISEFIFGCFYSIFWRPVLVLLCYCSFAHSNNSSKHSFNRVPTHLKSQGKSGIYLVREKSGNFVGSQGKLAMIIHVARVLSSVVVTDQLRHTRSFIGACSSKSTLSVTVLVFLKMAMERSRFRGGGADYKLHKTSSSICIGSGNSSKHSQGKSGKSQGISFLNLSGNPVNGMDSETGGLDWCERSPNTDSLR